MSRKIVILLVAGCFLVSGMMNSACGARIQSTDLSPAEAEALSQMQDVSATTIDTANGGAEEALWMIGIAVAAIAVCYCCL